MSGSRRIDRVLDGAFLADVEDCPLDELRERRALAHNVEQELSYYRRLLHGRMDLIRFELRRRSGEETRSLIEALPEILSDGEFTPSGKGRPFETDLPSIPEVGRRDVDAILGDDVLIRIREIEDAELAAALAAVEEVERDISERRHAVQQVEDALTSTFGKRFSSESID